MSYLMWLLGTKLESTARTTLIHDCWVNLCGQSLTLNNDFTGSVFMSAVTMACPEDSISEYCFPPSDIYILSAPSSTMLFEPWLQGGGILVMMSHLGLTAQYLSFNPLTSCLHIDCCQVQKATSLTMLKSTCIPMNQQWKVLCSDM